MQSLFRSLDAEAAAVTASTSAHAELEEGRPPWSTLGEQFAILEDELRARIMQISQCDAHFTAAQAASRRAGAIVPHCMPMARASLAEDPQLAALRFRLVPRKLTEEEFWRCGAAARERVAAHRACHPAMPRHADVPRHVPQMLLLARRADQDRAVQRLLHVQPSAARRCEVRLPLRH